MNMNSYSFEIVAIIVGLITIGGSSISAAIAFWRLFDRISKLEWEVRSVKRNIKRINPKIVQSNGVRD